MELSDFPMKKQIVFGQIWKRLVIIVVDLNYYELILVCIPPMHYQNNYYLPVFRLIVPQNTGVPPPSGAVMTKESL